MGYRSTIVIGMSKETYMKEAVLKELPAFFAYEQVEKEESTGNYYWYFEGYKWYSSYPDINEMEKFMERLDKEYNDTDQHDVMYPFGFMRIGEEDEDVETIGEPHEFQIYLQRSIESPIGWL